MVNKVVQDPGTWEYSCCGECVYKPGCCRTVKVQCPGRTVCCRVWCPKVVKKPVHCTRYVTQCHTRRVPYTICHRGRRPYVSDLAARIRAVAERDMVAARALADEAAESPLP